MRPTVVYLALAEVDSIMLPSAPLHYSINAQIKCELLPSVISYLLTGLRDRLRARRRSVRDLRGDVLGTGAEGRKGLWWNPLVAQLCTSSGCTQKQVVIPLTRYGLGLCWWSYDHSTWKPIRYPDPSRGQHCDIFSTTWQYAYAFQIAWTWWVKKQILQELKLSLISAVLVAPDHERTDTPALNIGRTHQASLPRTAYIAVFPP